MSKLKVKNRLPNFSTLVPIARILVDNFNFLKRDYRNVIPGTPPGYLTYYAMRVTGKLTIPTTGKYYFWVGSDDGSKFFINDKLVIDHDGIHAATRKASGPNFLEAGQHAFRLEYFQGPKFKIALRLYWERPDKNYKLEIIEPEFLEGNGHSDNFCL